MSIKTCGGQALRIVIVIVVMISFMVGVVNATPAPGLWKGTYGGGLDFMVSESGDSIINYTKVSICTLPWPPYLEYTYGGPIPIINDTFDDGRFSGTFTSSTEANGYFIPRTVIYNGVSRDCSGGYWSASSVVAPTETTASASRNIENQNLDPSGSTNVTVTIINNISQELSLMETIPSGWTLTRVSDDASAFNNSTNEWVWFNIGAGVTKTVIYKLNVPSDAISGTYNINGNISNSSGVIASVSGENSIIVSPPPPASNPVITDFKVVPNTSINETNSAVLSANITKAPDGSLIEVDFGIVDSNNLIGNDGQIIAEYRNFSGVEGLYKREWHAHYHILANATMSDNISVRDESDAPGYLIAIGSFKTNSTSNEIEDNALLWFNDTTLNLSKVTTRFIYGAVPLQIEDGNSTFRALIFKFNESGDMTVKYTSNKIFTLYNLTGNSSSRNPHLTRKNVPDGKYMAVVAAYGDNMSVTVRTVNIDTIQPSVSPPPVATFNISGFKINNANDSGIQGWNITVKNATMQKSLLTTADGSYKFTDLVNGTYNVSEEMKSGFTPVSATFQIVTIAGQDKTNVNFTNTPVTPAKLGSISGTKFNDSNGNGVRDTGEEGLPGWIIVLTMPDGSTENTTTNSDGFYIFSNLSAGNYTVGEVLKSGWNQTMPGLHPLQPCRFTSSCTYNVTLSARQSMTGLDFGNMLSPTLPLPPPKGSISGNVINVATGMGIPNVTIRLVGIVGTGIDTKSIRIETMTDSMGKWMFDNLPAGRYIIIEQLLKGFIPVTPPVMNLMLAKGQNSMNDNFTNKPVESLIPKLPLPPTPPLMEEQESK